MLNKLLLIVFLGACSAVFNENSLKRLAQLGRGIEQFSIDRKQGEAESAWRKLKDNKEDIMSKINSALLLKGTPMNAFRVQQLMPLFGLPVRGDVQKKPGHSKTSVSLKDYKIQNCSSSDAQKTKFVIRRLDVTPDPLYFPGTFNISFDISVLENIKQLKIDLVLYDEAHGSDIRIPCIGGFGSCTYNVCEMLEQVTSCPPELVNNKIPCKCPYNKRDYSLPGISVDIGGEFLPTGTYNATGKMTSKGEFIGCYNVVFTIS